MATNEFTSPIAIDFAPAGSSCQWCGQAAAHELTAIGGAFHNMSALLCRVCGSEFIKAVTGSSDPTILVAAKGGEVPHAALLGSAAYSEMSAD
jgi:hypothetical protein